MAFTSSVRKLFGAKIADPFIQHTLNPELLSNLNRTVHVKNFKNMGYGLAATRDLSIGEEVLRIPSSSWGALSAQFAEQSMSNEFKEVVEEFAIQQGGKNTLEAFYSSFMLKQTLYLSLHMLEAMENGTPNQKAYLRMMAATSLDVPLFWPEEDLSMLRGSQAFEEISERRNFIGWVYQSLVSPAVAQFKTNGTFQSASPSNFAWAMSVILSRAISGLGNQYSFVPVLDFLNHSPEYMDTFNVPPGLCHVTFDPESDRSAQPGADISGSFVVKSLANTKQGEQLFISYGDVGNATLLRMYGFALPHNPNDRVKVQMGDKVYSVSHHDPLPRTMLRDATEASAALSEVKANQTVCEVLKAELDRYQQMGTLPQETALEGSRYLRAQYSKYVIEGEKKVLCNSYETALRNLAQVKQLAQ